MLLFIRGLHTEVLKYLHVLPPELLTLLPYAHLIQALYDNIAALERPRVIGIICAVPPIADAVVHGLAEVVGLAGLALPGDVVRRELCKLVHPLVDGPERADELEGFFDVVREPELVDDFLGSLVLNSINKETALSAHHVEFRGEGHLLRGGLIGGQEFR